MRTSPWRARRSSGRSRELHDLGGGASPAARDPRHLQRGHPQLDRRVLRRGGDAREPRGLVRREAHRRLSGARGDRSFGRRRIRHLRRVPHLARLPLQRRAQRARARRLPGPRCRTRARAGAAARGGAHAHARHDRRNRCAKCDVHLASRKARIQNGRRAARKSPSNSADGSTSSSCSGSFDIMGAW